jgi:hypothetical protein
VPAPRGAEKIKEQEKLTKMKEGNKKESSVSSTIFTIS